MTSTDDLIARLRERTVTGHHPTALEVEAADRLTALQDRVNELEGALRKAMLSIPKQNYMGENEDPDVVLRLRRDAVKVARAVLAKGEKGS